MRSAATIDELRATVAKMWQPSVGVHGGTREHELIMEDELAHDGGRSHNFQRGQARGVLGELGTTEAKMKQLSEGVGSSWKPASDKGIVHRRRGIVERCPSGWRAVVKHGRHKVSGA